MILIHLYRLLASAFCFGIMVLIAGCSGGSADESTSRTLRFWHFWSEPGHKAALRELISSFEKENNCTVELTELSWNDGKAKLQAAFNSGAPPDVVELGSDWVAQFSGSGVLGELTTIDTSALISYALAPGRASGKLFAAPWIVDTRVVYVNTALVPGGKIDSTTTLLGLLAACEMIQSRGAFGWGANGADAHRLYKKILPFMWSCGGDILDAKGRCVLNSPENVRAFALYAEFARTGMTETQRQLDATFIQGKIGVWNSGSWLIKKIRSAKTLSVEAIPFPGVDGRPGVSFAGGEYLASSAASKQRPLAEKLITYLVSAQTAKKFCMSIPEAGFPAAVAAYDDPGLINDPLKAVFARQLRSARMTPVHPRWLDIESVLENAVVRVLLGEASPADALREAHDEVVQILG
ncbi:MAG: extracellular solute-binding protein [Candidatus Kapabacteria bacterium]|nr:extracellular solute-binding protein [Candidatus Kapabacteria bacterium]